MTSLRDPDLAVLPTGAGFIELLALLEREAEAVERERFELERRALRLRALRDAFERLRARYERKGPGPELAA